MSQLPIPGYDPNGDPPAGSPGLPKPDKPTYAGPTGRALEDQWMSFANNELGQKGQVGVAGGNAQANAGAAAARWNLGGTVDAYNAKYGGSARAVGEDKIDFGDGSGARDVIEGGGDNSKWWMGGADGGGGGGGGGRPGGPIDRPTGGGWRDAGYDTGPGAWGQGGGGGYGGGAWEDHKPYGPIDGPGYGGGDGSRGGGRGGGGGGGYSTGGGSWSGPQGGDGWYDTTPGQGTDLYNQLMARSKQGLTIDQNDPIIRNQTDSHNIGLERGRTQYLQQEAERGGANSNMGAERRASAEKVGQGTADFQSALMGREVAARREEIQNALSGMGQLLTAEQTLQLQEELAQLSRSEGRYEFDAGMRQRGYEFEQDDIYRNSPLGPGNSGG